MTTKSKKWEKEEQMETVNTEVVVEAQELASNEEQETKTFTQEELNSILAKERGKWEKKAEEAKRLAKMNAEEKAKYEAQQREEALSQREAELNKRELTAEAKAMLSEKGLSTELSNLINYENAESVKTSIETLEKVIQKAVENQVMERLKGTTPNKATTAEKTNFFELGAKI